MQKYYIETIEKRRNKYIVQGKTRQDALDNFYDWNHVESIKEKESEQMLSEIVNHVESIK